MSQERQAALGARKFRELLVGKLAGICVSSKSTVRAVLNRHGLVSRAAHPAARQGPA